MFPRLVFWFSFFALLPALWADDFAMNFTPTLTYSESYVGSVRPDGFGGFDTVVSSKLVLIAKCSLKGVDLSTINGFTEVTIDAGDFSFDDILLDADNYNDGDTSAVFTITDSIGDPVGTVTLTWNSRYVILGVSVTNDADDYEVEAQGIVDSAPADPQPKTSYFDTPLVDLSFGDRMLEPRSLYVSGTVAFSEDSRVSDLLPSIHLTGQIDSSPPTNVLIVDPPNGSTILSSPHLIMGTAMDTLGGMASVMVQINDGPLQNAHLDSATTWSLADAIFKPGKNKLVVQAADIDGNVRVAKPIYVTYSTKSTLTVQAAGDSPGTVRSGLFKAFSYVPGSPSPQATAIEESGGKLTVTAVPATGTLFAGWTSSAGALPNADAEELHFTMSPLLTLTANFAVNPFLPVLGTYHGLVQSAAPADNGFFSAKLTTSGHFTGTIKIGKLTVPITGKFGLDKHFSGAFVKAGVAYTVNLQVAGSGANGAGQITGTITDPTSLNASIAADVAGFKKKVNELSSDDVGSYNVILPAVQGNLDVNFPVGIGSGRVTLSRLGTAHFVGRLGDGTAISGGSTLSQGRVWPFYAALYGRVGSISGAVTLDRTQAATDLSGTLEWNRPASTSTRPVPFPTGFAGQSQFTGAKWTPWTASAGRLIFLNPSSGAGIVSLDAPAVPTSGLPLLATDNTAVLSGINTVTITPADPAQASNILLAIRPSTGTLSGSFMDAALKTHKFSGVIVSTPDATPKTDSGAGYFTWGNVTGSVRFSAP